MEGFVQNSEVVIGFIMNGRPLGEASQALGQVASRDGGSRP